MEYIFVFLGNNATTASAINRDALKQEFISASLKLSNQRVVVIAVIRGQKRRSEACESMGETKLIQILPSLNTY